MTTSTTRIAFVYVVIIRTLVDRPVFRLRQYTAVPAGHVFVEQVVCKTLRAARDLRASVLRGEYDFLSEYADSVEVVAKYVQSGWVYRTVAKRIDRLDVGARRRWEIRMEIAFPTMEMHRSVLAVGASLKPNYLGWKTLGNWMVRTSTGC